MHARQRHPRSLAATASAIAIALATAFACLAAAEPTTTEVRVERTRPSKETLPTLRFLKENRGFLRARLDLLRQKPIANQDAGAAFDARFLAYQEMLAAIHAARDATAAAEDQRSRRELIEHIAELSALESELDAMERLLAEQRVRLGTLQEDFVGRQETALMILVSGYPNAVALNGITIKNEEGETLTVELTDEQRHTLRQGGVVEVFHRFVEPREQVFEVAISGDAWPAGDHGYVTLEPERDRLTFLQLDVTRVSRDDGAAGIKASAWPHDASIPSSDG